MIHQEILFKSGVMNINKIIHETIHNTIISKLKSDTFVSKKTKLFRTLNKILLQLEKKNILII